MTEKSVALNAETRPGFLPQQHSATQRVRNLPSTTRGSLLPCKSANQESLSLKPKMDRNIATSKQSLSRPSSVTSMNTTSTNKNRQYAHLHAQLAQLNAHLADTENLLRMTAVQAQDMRFLGGYVGALFMGSAKVLGEESVQGRGKQEEATKET